MRATEAISLVIGAALGWSAVATAGSPTPGRDSEKAKAAADQSTGLPDSLADKIEPANKRLESDALSKAGLRVKSGDKEADAFATQGTGIPEEVAEEVDAITKRLESDALSKAGLRVKNAKKGDQEGQDLVRVTQIDGEAVVRRILSHKTFSPDRRLFAGYYRDGWDEVISIHDAKSGKQIKRIVGHGDDVRELKFTPDGKLLASRCVNRSRKGWALWNVSTGELVLRLPVPPTKD